MKIYTLLNLLIIVPALALSFDRKVAFWKSWLRALVAILIVGGAFTVWDILVTQEGHWAFSPEHAGTARLFGLPAGEILFFISTPFACIFILEVVRAYFKERCFELSRPALVAAAALSALAAFLLRDRGYSFIVFSTLALCLLLMAGPGRSLFSRRSTWTALGLTYIPFLIFNGIYTGIPIVSYDPAMIMGPRIISIPVEDFLYSFSLIALSYIVFDGVSPRKTVDRK